MTRNVLLATMMVVVLCLGGSALAGMVTLEPTMTRTLHTGEPDTVNAWGDFVVRETGEDIHSAATYDLSGITEEITGAYMRFYELDNSNNSVAVAQSGHLISPVDITNITPNKIFGASPEFTWTALDSLGSYTGDDSTAVDTWYNSEAASSGDVAAIEALRGGSVSILIFAESGKRWWGGTDASCPPQLVLTTVPEPATLSLLVAGGALALIRRRR